MARRVSDRLDRLPSANVVVLRDVLASDLDVFYENQLDAQANWMAAFTAKDPADRAAFDAHWNRILADTERVIIKTVLVNGRVAGSVLAYAWGGEWEVSYWLGRSYWGRGIATRALTAFLELFHVRPLAGRAAKDNLASIRVLEKCGFVPGGEARGFANARGAEIGEVILILK